MDLNRFTQKAQQAILDAQKLTTEYSHPDITPEHILLALLNQTDGIVPEILARVGARPQILSSELEGTLRARGTVTGSNVSPTLSRQSTDSLNRAEKEASRLKDDYVSTEHILLGLMEDRGIHDLLERHAVTRDEVMKSLQTVRGSQRVTSQNPETTYQALDKYGRDLTQLARQGKLDPVIGRDEEIRRVVQVRRYCRAAPKTIQCSSARRVLGRPLLSKGWRSAS
jgi:ATP-dependent Clp protease ATP-binding subunit ClpB